MTEEQKLADLTLQDIRDAVAEIDAIKGDDEYAHQKEDDLYSTFIAYVALTGPPNLAEMAGEVLKTGSIDFSRWCA